MDKITIRAAEIVARCQRLAAFSEESGAICRTFLSAPMRDCHREIAKWLDAAGARVHVDAAGNLRGYYPAAQSSAPSLLIGSHLDTVPNAGAFDGVLGVVLAVALLEALEGKRLPFAIEVLGFSEEEGVRFGVPFIGSRALAGRLDDELLNRRDPAGISVRAALENFGLNPAEIPHAVLHENSLGYLEFHIEQGPVLDTLGLPLAAVDSIVGQTRMELHFTGRTNHAGTTPMHLRRDALAGAAEWISTVERAAQQQSGLVATVGRIEAKPSAINAIPGEVFVTLDLRHKSDNLRARAETSLVGEAENIASCRGLSVEHNVLLHQPAIAMDPFLAAQIQEALRKTGCPPHCMPSGAGHDAMILAEKIPSAMIFLRTPGGVSHDPAESVRTEDVAKALECGLHLLGQFANSSEFLKRTCRA